MSFAPLPLPNDFCAVVVKATVAGHLLRRQGAMPPTPLNDVPIIGGAFHWRTKMPEISAQEYALANALLSENQKLEKRIEELERRLLLRDDYQEMLIRYMRRTHWWVNFRREYPSIAADMERWVERRREKNQDD